MGTSAGVGYCSVGGQQPLIPTTQRIPPASSEKFSNPQSAERMLASSCSHSSQGKDTAADYSLTFRTLAAQTGWGNGPLKLLYRKGLLAELQSELACRDEGRTLEEFINITIRLGNLLRSRRSPLTSGPTTVSEPEPMHIGITRLSSEEKERRFRNHLCLYCGQSGHLRVSCPTRPPTKSTFSGESLF